MKTKTTKLSVLAFLGLGLAVYGQSGKVGVNISSPRATLDVQPSVTNSQGDAKTNEGILAPQLSKTRVASIEVPVEGTLVYVIDDANKTNGTITAYTGADPKVAKITEKGYYYYNGTEWVKSTANSNGELWKEQDGDKVKLVSNIINNEVFYTANGYKFYPKGLTELVDYDYSTSSVRTSNLSSVKPLDLRVINLSSHEQPTPTSIGNYVYSGVKNRVYLDDINTPTVEKTHILPYDFYTGIKADYNKNINLLRGFTSSLEKMNNTDATALTAIQGRSVVSGTGNIVQTVGVGSYHVLDKKGGKVEALGGMISVIESLPSNQASIGNVSGFRSIGTVKGSGNIENYLAYTGVANGAGYQGKITNYYDYHASNPTIPNITNLYGVYIEGGSKTNYFEGKLGVGTITPSEKLEVAGSVKATGFIGANAAIFPDYVFQKYYTGTSSLKADYSFKTLSQVEDFVKTNGHLPGYKSAAEIKKQGYVDLMATQLTNVEKIEELYLHLLEKDKEVKALKAKNEELETRLEQIEKLLK